MKTVLDPLIYVLVRLFLLGLLWLPARLAYAVCERLAEVAFWLDRKHRRIGMINLGVAFPGKGSAWKRRILRRSYRQLGHQAVELSRLPVLTRERLAGRVQYEEGRGLENYRKARKKGQPVLFVTAHLSAWELLPAAQALYGHPLTFLVRPLDNPYLEAWLTRLRTRHGNRVLSKRGSIKQVLRVLEEGGDVGFLIDQNIQEQEGVYAPFFGRPACTSSAPAALALKTGVPVITGFIYPVGRPGHYRIRFYPPLELVSSGDQEKDVVENTALFNRRIEEVVREYPHCWLWGHRRFETQPKGRNPYTDASRPARGKA